MILKSIKYSNLNKNLKEAEYAVRGLVPIRAGEIQKEIEQGS